MPDNELEDLRAAVARVRALHTKKVLTCGTPEQPITQEVCSSCIGAYEQEELWPCRTIQELDLTPDDEYIRDVDEQVDRYILQLSEEHGL